MKRIQTLALVLALAHFFPAASPAFHKESENQQVEQQAKDIKRLQEKEKEKFRKELIDRDRAKQNREDKFVVRVHAKGDSPTRRDGSKVIDTFEISQGEYAKKDYRKAVARGRSAHASRLGNNPVYASARPSGSSGGASASTASSTPAPPLIGAWVWILLFLAVGVWWITRSRDRAEL